MLVARCRAPPNPPVSGFRNTPAGPVTPGWPLPGPVPPAPLGKLTFPEGGLPVSLAWINAVGPDESGAHGADDNIVFLHFGSEAVEEA